MILLNKVILANSGGSLRTVIACSALCRLTPAFVASLPAGGIEVPIL